MFVSCIPDAVGFSTNTASPLGTEVGVAQDEASKYDLIVPAKAGITASKDFASRRRARNSCQAAQTQGIRYGGCRYKGLVLIMRLTTTSPTML
jgi:hypothetical protein